MLKKEQIEDETYQLETSTFRGSIMSMQFLVYCAIALGCAGQRDY